jgi:hypothetical protein
VPIVRQISILAENRPGALAKLTRVLAAARVNLLAISVPDNADQGILRLVPDDAAQLKSLLLQKGLSFSEAKVLAVSLGNRPGALHEISQKLKGAKIDVLYAYGSAPLGADSATLIFNVSDLMRAKKLLESK